MEKISVIIPVYNREKFIKKCLDSVISQTYTNIEIMVIDDGCTDNTINIVKQYKNVKLYHNPKNLGLGYSRNRAIKECNANLFLFLDSDDTLEKNCIELLYNKMISTNADIVMGSYDEDLKEEIILDNTNKFDPLLDYSIHFFVTACNKLYKKELFNNFEYPKIPFAEDEAAIHLILNNTNKMVIIPNKTYNYYINPNGLSKTTEKNHMIAANIFFERHLFFRNTKYDIPSYVAFKEYVFKTIKLLISKNKNINNLTKYFFKHLELKYIRYVSIREILFLLLSRFFNKKILFRLLLPYYANEQ